MKGAATELIHAGELDRGIAAPLTTPIYETTTFVFDNAQEVVAYNEGRSARFLYSRYTNPTVVSVEQKLAAVDRTEAALVFSSGMGASATILLAHLKAGDEILCGAAIYGGTLHLLHDLLAKLGIVPRFISLDELANLDRVFTDRTRMVWFESPINPTLRCVDIRRVSEACRARGVTSVIDNTFASPINQQPLALGIDLAMQSATKYLNGHSDLIAGALMGAAARVREGKQMLDHLGGPIGIGPYADRRDEVLEVWRASMREVARRENVVLKLGGIGMPIYGMDWHHRARMPSSKSVAVASGRL